MVYGRAMRYTVGKVARLTGVTVRTLHHYHTIGLLEPGERSAAGYRLYATEDLTRLQQILLYRELGVPLHEIAQLLDDPGFDREDALRRQRASLGARVERLQRMIAAVDRTLVTLEKGEQMTADDIPAAFDGFDPNEDREEAERRWGHSAAYQESVRRISRYGREGCEEMQAEAASINSRFFDLMSNGADAQSAAAMEAAESHRRHITEWFYECTPQTHAGLGEMYLADERFRNKIDESGDGLAAFMAAAIAANAARS